MRRVIVAMLGVVVAALVLIASPAAGRAADEPTKVTVGVYVNDVQDLDLENSHYLIDFYLWFRWDNPDFDPTGTIEIMNLTESWGLMATPAYEEPLELEDGSLYNIIHYQGKFNNELPLESYPFDKQNLIIEFEDNSSNNTALVYVADDPGATTNPKLALPGWEAGTASLEVYDHTYSTDFGMQTGAGETYSRILLTIPVERPAVTSAIKLFFPLGLVLLTAVLTYFLLPSMVESRIGTAITALLTLVALQFTVNDNLPQVEYLMMIDVIYALSFLYVLFTLGTAVYSAWVNKGQDSAEAVAFDRKMLVLGLVVYAILFALTMFYFLR